MQSRIQAVVRCIGCFRGKANADDLLKSVDRVQEQTQKEGARRKRLILNPCFQMVHML